jgi:hypothetical protein
MASKRNIPRVCEQCGKDFLAKRQTVQRTGAKYCSPACYHAARKDFPPESSPKWKGGLVQCVCEQCGQTFERYPAHVGAFCSRSCASRMRSKGRGGPRSPDHRKGSRYVDKDGYVHVTLPTGRRALEHRLVMEECLGRPLRDDEDVHHIRRGKEARSDNRIENLEVLPKADHTRLHHTGTRLSQWARHFACCVICGKTEHKHAGHGLCKQCDGRERYRRTHGFSPTNSIS